MRNAAHPYWLTAALLALALLLSVAVGSVFIPPQVVAQLLFARLSGGDLASLPADWRSFATILFDLRLPRTAMVALIGAALAGSGASYQGLFRNPLADPYLIGVASGAGMGAVLVLTVQWPGGMASMFVVPLAAFIGAMLTVLVVYRLARVGRTLPVTTLILAGVAISSFANAVTSFLMLQAGEKLHRALSWLLGGSAMSGWQPVLAALPYVALGLVIQLTLGHALNVLQFGDEQATQLGLPVERVRRWLVLSASLTTAAAVAFAGIIGFVGLVVPHIVRMVWGGDYRRVLPLSYLVGAIFLLVADVLARVVLAPQELPVGVITALAGAPFFLWLLRRSRQQNYW